MENPVHATFRIIDANLNRAREALRVMEEYARLGLDDAGLTSAIKEARHELAAAVGELENAAGREVGCESARTEARGSGGAHDSLMAHRDIAGDVGCDLGTAAEYERSGALHVALAAGKRLSEALRAVEEFGKTVDRGFAAAVERLRYKSYELERRIYLTRKAGGRFGHVRLYVIITESLCHSDWLATAEAVIHGGADCLQLREKGLPDGELLDRARRLSRMCRDRDVLFIVNDRPDIALLSGADGVHLGQSDIPVSEVRRIVPPTCLIGMSTHTIEQVEAAAAAAPDYLAVGPMFATSTKPQDHTPGPQLLCEARKRTSLPLVAVGGIDEGNVGTVTSAAECAVCICRAVIGKPDAAGATFRLRALVDGTIYGETAAP